jgi:NADH-quinone oxidoreductase subunit L
MLIPLGVLALGALFAGGVFDHSFVGEGAANFWRGTVAAFTGHGTGPSAVGELPAWEEAAPLVLTILGFAVAWFYYILHPERPAQMAAKRGMLYLFLYNKWYFDELYDFLFVRPTFRIARFLWKEGDGKVIDGLGPDGIAARVLDVTRETVRVQSGYLYHYAFAMLLGVVGLITWFMVTGVTP